MNVNDLVASVTEIKRDTTGGLDVDEVLEHYIEAALWNSSNNRADEESEEYDPEASENLDGDYDASDLAPETLEKMRGEVLAFCEAHHEEIKTWCGQGGTTPEQQAGYDLWMTRVGSGVGFWEDEWGEPGKALDKYAKQLGEFVYLYVGDDGKIYMD